MLLRRCEVIWKRDLKLICPNTNVELQFRVACCVMSEFILNHYKFIKPAPCLQALFLDRCGF